MMLVMMMMMRCYDYWRGLLRDDAQSAAAAAAEREWSSAGLGLQYLVHAKSIIFGKVFYGK